MALADGLLVVDYAPNGQAIGVEITAPLAVPLERLNSVLVELGESPLAKHEDGRSELRNVGKVITHCSSLTKAGERRMVDQICASSNPLLRWLKRVDALRNAA